MASTSSVRNHDEGTTFVSDLVSGILDGCMLICATDDLAHDTFAFELGAGELIQPEYDSGKCAICLDTILLEETGLIKGCGHTYCINCILQWVTYHKDAPRCPQCKNHFNYLYTYRCLDGNLCDTLLLESVTLLLRARWFKGKVVSDDEDDDYDDNDAEDEDYYYDMRQKSVVLGNRRFGETGFVSGGRRQARPVIQPNKASSTRAGGSSSSSPQISAKKAQREAKKEEKANKEAERRAKRINQRSAPLRGDNKGPAAGPAHSGEAESSTA